MSPIAKFVTDMLIVLVCITGSVGAGFMWGEKHVQTKWDTEKAKAVVVVAHQEKAAAEATVKVVTKYVDRIRTAEGKTREIEKLVPVYLPADPADCRLPAAWRVLHDAAASESAIPESPGRLEDAAGAVDPATAAETVVHNYGTCHAWREQLIALQEWVREMEKINNEVAD